MELPTISQKMALRICTLVPNPKIFEYDKEKGDLQDALEAAVAGEDESNMMDQEPPTPEDVPKNKLGMVISPAHFHELTRHPFPEESVRFNIFKMSVGVS